MDSAGFSSIIKNPFFRTLFQTPQDVMLSLEKKKLKLKTIFHYVQNCL